jgi:IS1 family transposase
MNVHNERSQRTLQKYLNIVVMNVVNERSQRTLQFIVMIVMKNIVNEHYNDNYKISS